MFCPFSGWNLEVTSQCHRRQPESYLPVSGIHAGVLRRDGNSARSLAPLALGPTSPQVRRDPGHQNLTFWTTFVHRPFAREYGSRRQTVLARHGLHADRLSGLLIAAEETYKTYKEYLICHLDADSGSRRWELPPWRRL